MNDDTPAVVITENDNIEEFFDDDNEDEVLKMTAVEFTVNYLLQDKKFAEWYFGRNRWDEVENSYDASIKAQSVVERKSITVDLKQYRSKATAQPKRTNLTNDIISALTDKPMMTMPEILQHLGREWTESNRTIVQKIINSNPDVFESHPQPTTTLGVGRGFNKYSVKENK